MSRQKTVAIFTMEMVQGSPPWDPDSIHTGIGGSEEAVIYMAQHLARMNYKVLVIGSPPLDSVHSSLDANPRFVDQTFYPSETLDIGIAWRNHNLGKVVRPFVKKLYLWPHDTNLIESPREHLEVYDGVFWLSRWQKDYFARQNPIFCKFDSIFGNGIEPAQFEPIRPRNNPHSCIYGSSYDRGLEILLDLWPKIKEEFPRATLDIYSGMHHLNIRLPDLAKRLRYKIDSLSGVVDHGKVGHIELNRAYARASFWTYPCTFPEVFCITALRAQLSGAVPIVIKNYALWETVRHGYTCRDSQSYFETLRSAFKDAGNISLQTRKRMGTFVLSEFTWHSIAQKWDQTFN